MPIHRHSILTAIALVIILAVLALCFFWIEETIPQDNQVAESPVIEGIDGTSETQLYLTIMTHMERNFKDDENEYLFLDHVEEIRYGMALADEVGAKLNIETEQAFALANRIWGIPILREIVESGHGVQTHCDLGQRYIHTSVSDEEYAEAFRENKDLVDAAVGAENNLGCSGGASVNDWAIAASLAGFNYINGIVAGHMLAMPYENRPGTQWTDEYIAGEGWHENISDNVADTIYPVPLANAQDFEPDSDPVIVMMAGTIGRIDQAEEEEDNLCIKQNNCAFTKADIDVLVDEMRDIADQYDPERGVAKITVYVPVEIYSPENEAVLNYFFSEVKKLETQGLIKFGTHKEIYEAYIAQIN